MHFRVTHIASGEAGFALCWPNVRLEKWLNVSLGDRDFGIGVGQFVFMVISVDDDLNENSRRAAAQNKTGRYKHPVSGESVSYISRGIHIPPSEVVSLTQHSLLSRIGNAAIDELRVRPKRVPKGFDYAQCSGAMTAALRALAESAP